MKSFKQLTYLFLLISILFSCSDDDNDEAENEPPSSFDVFVSVGANALEVNWTEAIDPEGEDVTYDVYLNGELKNAPQYMTSELTYLLLWQDVNVGENTISVIAMDESGEETESSTVYENIPN